MTYFKLSVVAFLVLFAGPAFASTSAGSFDPSSFTTKSARPSLSGTASGTSVVAIMITANDGSDDTVYVSGALQVTNGTWQASLARPLKNGSYTVLLYDSVARHTLLAKGTLSVGTTGSTVAGAPVAGSVVLSGSSISTPSTLSISQLPLLSGGATSAGASVPVAYIKIVNTGKSTATITGVRLIQNGTAPGLTVLGFATSDDKGGSRATIVGAEGTTPFVNGRAFVPLQATLTPGQLRIFTIKAVLSKKSYSGKTLMIDTDSVDTTSKITTTLPLRGVTWTLR